MKITYEQWEEANKQIEKRHSLIWEIMYNLTEGLYDDRNKQYNDMIRVGNMAEQQRLAIIKLNKAEVI